MPRRPLVRSRHSRGRSRCRALRGVVALKLASACLPAAVWADEPGEVIFADDFERAEQDDAREEVGRGWNTNSKARAKGNKQVDLQDGTLRIFISPEADHAVSVTHPAEFTDGSVSLRFLLEDPRDSLGLNFADLTYKPVHAGHLFMVKVNPKQVVLQDLKTGVMDLAIRQARQEKTLTETQQALLTTKQRTVPHAVAVGTWHDLVVRVRGNELAVAIDGTDVGNFRSEGIAHPTKRTLRLAVPRNAVVDDVVIRRVAPANAATR
jgi:hypothetical protein